MNGKVNNALYSTTIDIGASRFKQFAWYFINIIFFRNPLNFISSSKVLLLRFFGAKIGSGVLIKPSVNIKYPWKLEVGSHCWIGENVWIDNLSEVLIGESVTLSQGVLLLTGSHDHSRSTFDFLSSRIVLENGVWIGAKAVVLGGVVCRSHSVLGVSGVTSRELKAYTIYQGNPATAVMLRQISDLY
jgi:putative colanic acid biosynthesis acetyltransferase WcaF